MSMKNVDEKCVNLRLNTLWSLSGHLSRPEVRRIWNDDEVNDMKKNGGAMVKFKNNRETPVSRHHPLPSIIVPSRLEVE